MLRGGGRRPRVRARRSRRSTRPASTRPCRVGAVAQPLEGAARPGHFDGVATVVAILFDAGRRGAGVLRPEGLQQVKVIRRMALRPRAADGGGRLPDGPRGGRPRAVVAQRPPRAGANALRRRCSGGRSWRPRCVGGRRATANALRAACGRRSRRSGSRRSTTSRSPTVRDPRRARSVEGPGARVARGPLRGARLIDNERLGSTWGTRLRLPVYHC